MSRLVFIVFLIGALMAAEPALAWGALGHEVTALIAYKHLTPAARTKVDALLASDHDALTGHDFASRATWADAYRETHRQTSAWHFVDIEIDHPDLTTACFGFPKLSPGELASQGPAQDCVVDKIDEFAAELKKPATPAAERLLAFKFLIHFVGDLTQPLHAADHRDRGGNCVGLADDPDGLKNLHAWWDVGAMKTLGSSPQAIATDLDQRITSQEARDWSRGDARTWAMDTFQVAKAAAYDLPSKPTCDERGSIILSPAYKVRSSHIAAVQLQKAGVRIAAVLNHALD
jgi:hypothetical protein